MVILSLASLGTSSIVAMVVYALCYLGVLCMCVCVCERERVCVRVYVCERERECVCARVCV